MTLQMNIDRKDGPGWTGGTAIDTSRSAFGFSDSLLTIAHPTEPLAEAVRQLRTHVVSQHLAKGGRGLAVCSPENDAGCTFVASNLAVALSQAGVNTLLLDADLRQPGVENFIRPPSSSPGLRDALQSSGIDFIEAVHTDVLPNLSVMYAGGAAPDAQELLSGERFKALMDFCLREFDATIIDTPPANRFSDVSRVAHVVGYAVVVARRNFTLVHDVKVLMGQLQSNGASVVGTVLNDS